MPGILELVLGKERMLEDESFGEVRKRQVRLSYMKLPKIKRDDEFRLDRSNLDEAYSCTEAIRKNERRYSNRGIETVSSIYDHYLFPFEFKAWVKFTVNNNRNLDAFHRFLRGQFHFRPYGKRGAGKLILELDQVMGFMDVVAFDEEYIKRKVDFFPCNFNIALAGFGGIFKCKPFGVHSKIELEVPEGGDLEQAKERIRKYAVRRIFNFNNDFEFSEVRDDLHEGFIRLARSKKEYYSWAINRFEINKSVFTIPKLLNKEALEFMVNAVFNKDFKLFDQLDIIRTKTEEITHSFKYEVAALIAVAALQALGERGSCFLPKTIIFASKIYRFYRLNKIEGKFRPIGALQFRCIGQDLLNKLFEKNMEKVEVKYGDFYMEGELKIAKEVRKGFYYPYSIYEPSDLEGVFNLKTFIEARERKELSFHYNAFVYVRFEPSQLILNGIKLLLDK